MEVFVMKPFVFPSTVCCIPRIPQRLSKLSMIVGFAEYGWDERIRWCTKLLYRTTWGRNDPWRCYRQPRLWTKSGEFRKLVVKLHDECLFKLKNKTRVFFHLFHCLIRFCSSGWKKCICCGRPWGPNATACSVEDHDAPSSTLLPCLL